MRADSLGAQLKKEFIEQRITSDQLDFFDRVKRQCLLAMEHENNKSYADNIIGKGNIHNTYVIQII